MTKLERELKDCLKESKKFDVEDRYYRGLKDAYNHLGYFMSKKH